MRNSLLPLLLAALAQLLLLSPLVSESSGDLRFDASMDVFLAADERTSSSFDKLQTLMSDQHVIMIVLGFDGIFSDAGARLLADVGAALERVPGISRALSLVRATRPVKRGLGLAFEPFVPLEHESDADWERIEQSVTTYPWARDLLVSRDGRYAMVVAETTRPVEEQADRVALREDVLEALRPFEDRVDSVHVTAFPFIEAEIQEGVEHDLKTFLVVLPILLVAILLVTFRSLLVLLCVLAFEAAGLGLLPILFRWDGTTINLYTAILFPLVAGLQLTFLTHLIAALQWTMRRGAPFAAALPAALGQVLRPSLVAAATTVIGLLSLLVCDVGLVRDFGRLGAYAVVLVFGVTFVPPMLLSRMLRRAREGVPVPSDRPEPPRPGHRARLQPFVAFVSRRRVALLAVTALLCLASLPALDGVRTDLRAIEFLSPDSPSRQGLQFVDANVGGMNVFELELDTGRAGGIRDRAALEFLERVRAYAEKLPGVTDVYTYSQIYTVVNRLWNDDDPAAARLPESDLGLGLVAGLVHNADLMFSEAIYDDAQRTTTLYLRTHDMPAHAYLALLEELLDFAQDARPEGMELRARAGIHSVLESDRRVVASQLESLGLCALSVFLTLCVLWRSPKLALLVMLCNLPALCAVLAVIGYAGIPLNSITVMVSAIVLGIAVDDAIHLLSFWKHERAAFDDPADALCWVLAHKLVPMACTSAVLVAGLGLFLGASFPPVADFGLLSIVALVVSLAAVALVLPPLLLVTDGGRPAGGAAAREVPGFGVRSPVDGADADGRS
ncbi:MAG: MMPL family transporter [Planctomycetes bacterium]|nr:MMPL family transporter [Planctomycetota bacterium]